MLVVGEVGWYRMDGPEEIRTSHTVAPWWARALSHGMDRSPSRQPLAKGAPSSRQHKHAFLLYAWSHPVLK